MMKPSVERLFAEAAELPRAERTAFIAEHCSDDPVLRGKLERLLRAHDGAGGFLASPTVNADRLVDADATVASRALPIPGVGSMVGRYKLLQSIGAGGFGEVFMAEQKEPVLRKVALKIIKLGMDTRQVVARFEAERQALAMMDHPNIATILDGGSTPEGRPYFVMELVHGIPITEYCNKNRLSTADRLGLFAAVCRAVQHAHQKGVIHRDIKPSNVLVTLHDGEPVPKIIDFGIAKATHAELTDKTLFTEFRQMIGTPAYMSPEQAEMSGLDIDTRSDVYSLGVLLYHLLTGSTPFDNKRLMGAGPAEIQRIIREEEPERPSSRLSTLGDELPTVARERGAAPEALGRLLRGDLDWIVMKALEKDRTRRYETAVAMAQDIERHLNDEPVSASPPGAAYRCRKFLRRHRPAVGAVAAIVAGLIIAGGAWAWSVQQDSARRAERTGALNAALDRAGTLLGRAIASPLGAEAEWGEARAVVDQVDRLVASGGLAVADRKRAETLIRRFRAADVERRMARRIEQTVIAGATHLDRESWLAMERGFREAFRDYGIDLTGNTRQEVARLIRESGSTYTLTDGLELWIGTLGQLGMYGPPVMSREDMEAWVEVLYEVDADPLRTGIRKAIYSGRPATRDELSELLALVNHETVHPRTLSWLAFALFGGGQADGADDVFRRALLYHPGDFMLNFDYAYLLVGQQRWAEAVPYFMRCVALRPRNGGVWRGLGMALAQTEKHDGAIDALRRSIDVQPGHAPTHADLGRTMYGAGRYEEAAAACREAIDLDPTLALAHGFLGRSLQKLGRLDEALSELELSKQRSVADPGWQFPTDDWIAECRALLEKNGTTLPANDGRPPVTTTGPSG